MPAFVAVFLIGFCVVGASNLIVLGVTDKFFNALVSAHPHLKDSFQRPPFPTQYGPIFPSKMSYLNAREFDKLSQPELRELGRRALRALNIHKALFFTVFFGGLSYVLFSSSRAP